MTIDQNQTVQSYLKLANRILERMNLELVAGADRTSTSLLPDDYRPHRRAAHPRPRRLLLPPDNAFWIRFRPRLSEHPIALCAHRIIQTECLVSEMYTHTVFSDIGPVVDAHDIGLQPNLPHIAGRLGSNGGIVVDTEWRGRRLDGWPDLRLGGLIARIGQALSIRRFRIDFQ
ncbi:MAG: hypothetical protein VW405_07000 [Rhodospirillaceae bacterium]